MKRRTPAFVFLLALATGQEDPGNPTKPDVFDQFPELTKSPPDPEEDPLRDILNGNEQKPFSNLPSGVDIEAKSISIDGTTDGNAIVSYEGNIILKTDTGLDAYADRATADLTKKTILLEGNVSLFQDGLAYRGQSSTFNLETKSFETRNLRLGFSPLLVEAERIRKIEHEGRPAYVADRSGITTHDVENPDFWLRARRTTIFPDDKVIFQDFNLEVNSRNYFWLPYLSQPLDANLGYLVIPGGQTNLGAFIKNRYGIMLGGERNPMTGEKEGATLLSQWHADLYSNKGLGLGLDLFDTRVDRRDQFDWLKLYYIYDLNPEDERAGIDRGNLNPNRFRVDFNYRLDFFKTEVAEYSFDANLNWLSDEYFLEDFDPLFFRINRAPDNFLGFFRRSANSLTSLGTRLRLNNFYRSDSRLPELTHDWIRQPFLNTSFLYESQTSIGVYREELADLERRNFRNELDNLLPGDPRREELERLLDDRGFSRFHTYHEFSLPRKFGHFNVTPRFGAGHTNYWAVQEPNDSTSRTHLTAAVDVSTKLTKYYPKLVSEKWGLEAARHVIEPYASLSWLSTNELDNSFGRVERLTPTSRPRPRHVGRFIANDDLADWSILRLGMRNRLVTQRDGSTHDWLTLDTYIDAFIEDPELDRDFSNLYNDLRWSPLPWLELNLETQFPISPTDNFTEVASSIRFMPLDKIEFTLDYRHLNNHPILRDSDRIVFESFTRFNEYWGVGTHHRFELVDSTLELQQYSAHYDFDSFVGSFGFFIRNNQDQDELGIMLSFGIKEIPNLSLPIEFGAQ